MCTVLVCILQIVFDVCACTEMTGTAGTARRPHSDAGPTWGADQAAEATAGDRDEATAVIDRIN